MSQDSGTKIILFYINNIDIEIVPEDIAVVNESYFYQYYCVNVTNSLQTLYNSFIP